MKKADIRLPFLLCNDEHRTPSIDSALQVGEHGADVSVELGHSDLPMDGAEGLVREAIRQAKRELNISQGAPYRSGAERPNPVGTAPSMWFQKSPTKKKGDCAAEYGALGRDRFLIL
ncbi:hypothetical protein N9C70_02530 [Flavobacteriales bacterium]|nr:hypothetical protein [Flavobacteriales bacterium]